jgi:enoyl-CoA hydratase/carnithine racemase
MTPTNATAAAQAATPMTTQTRKTDPRQPKAEPAPNGDFYQLVETSQSEGSLLEASYFGLCAATEDKTEGTTAFLEKRAPRFHGR